MSYISFLIDQCPENTVTIYKDRAELNRSIPFKPTFIGDYEITILNVTNNSDPDTIRVSFHDIIDTNTKNIYSINQVSHTQEYVSNSLDNKIESSASEKDKDDIQNQIKSLQKKIILLERKLIRVNQQQSMLGTFTNAALVPSNHKYEEILLH